MKSGFVLCVAAGLLAPCVATSADKPTPAPSRQDRLKTSDVRLSSGNSWVTGVVEKIDDDGMTVVQVNKDSTTTEHHYLPTDLLREGKVYESGSARYSYRWQAVKRGDLIEVVVGEDRIDKKLYCTEISILERPTGRLPRGERDEEDRDYLWRLVCNDLKNGVDVTDEEIKKAYPPRKEVRGPRGEVVQPAYAGGLPPELQKKLDAIRAKKAKAGEKPAEPKAPPPADKK